MKKATIVVLDSRREQELANLKRLGLLHPDIERRTGERAEALQSSRELLQRAIGELPDQARVPESQPLELDRALDLARDVHAAAERRRAHRESVEKIESEVARVALWGDFDPSEIRSLAERGIDCRLFSMAPRDFRKRGPNGALVLDRDAAAVRFAMIWYRGGHPSGRSPEEIAQLSGCRVFRIPDHSPRELAGRLADERAAIDDVNRILGGHARYRESLDAALRELELRLRDEQVRLGMDTADRLAFITGYIPADAVDALRREAAGKGWATLIRDPEAEDPVPTQIRNPRWIRIIRPVFGLLGVVPGYRERDISVFFLMFFIVFVGMIIGDAGYGAILLIAGLVLTVRSSGRGREGAALLLVLSVSTLAWGALTGNWFGYEPIGKSPFLRSLIVPALDSFDPRSTQAVQSVCFVLAALHLSIAHLWNFFRGVREKPAIKAFAQLGWLAVILGLYFLIGSLFLGTAFPDFALYLIGAGIVSVFLFSGQSADTGFFGGIGRGLSNAFTIVFDGIGAFSDIISYIRLFAVGLATVAIAQAFNEMAASVGTGGAGMVLAVVILLFGHTLNLIMAGLAVVVHGVRLNLLEFSGHLGMEWTGIEYQPFSEDNRSAS